MAMDYEKKYKEAVNKIKNLLDDGEKNGFTIVTYKTDLESIFPELKESEDERIRKELIEHCKNQAEPYIKTGNKCPQIQSWIAWLEKQGEQKVNYTTLAETGNGGINALVTREVSANDYEEEPVIKMKSPEESLGISSKKYNNIVNDCIYGEQKPAWSEEDSKRLQRIIDFLWHNRKGDTDTIYQQEQDVDWLKSLRPQKQWKPTKEQMDALAWALSLAKNCGEECAFDLRTLQDQLKKLTEE